MPVVKRKRGGQSKLTAAKVKKIAAVIQRGGTMILAAHEAKISIRSLHRWVDKGKHAKSGQYAALWQSIQKAESVRRQTWLDRIDQASREGVWQASAWLLERFCGDEFAKPEVKLKHSGEVNNPGATPPVIKIQFGEEGATHVPEEDGQLEQVIQ